VLRYSSWMTLLACQSDSYRRELTARVCAVFDREDSVDVLLEDTILYPEGGGQPDDYGTLDGQPVLALKREPSGGVLHRVARAPAADQVTLQVDWSRRFDHMQQHTAQHLITALAADQFGCPTLDFHLLPDLCDIALEGSLTDGQLSALMAMANQAIRDALPVRTRLVSPDQLDNVRSRKLPVGLSGPVRLVSIGDLDLNTCGGTHVASSAQLQCIHFLPPQPHRNGMRLRFLAGGRVMKTLSSTWKRQQALSGVLSCGPEAHLDAVSRIQQDSKAASRVCRQLQEELGGHIGAQLVREGRPHLHREGADLNFLKSIASAVQASAPDQTILLTGAGVFLLAGVADVVSAVGPTVAGLLSGRGGGSGGRFQGRMTSMARIDDCLRLLR